MMTPHPANRLLILCLLGDEARRPLLEDPAVGRSTWREGEGRLPVRAPLFRAAATPIELYDACMTPAIAAKMKAGDLGTRWPKQKTRRRAMPSGEHPGMHIATLTGYGRVPFSDVAFVGGHLYLDVMRHIVDLFRERGHIVGDARITEINGSIGMMRRELRRCAAQRICGGAPMFFSPLDINPAEEDSSAIRLRTPSLGAGVQSTTLALMAAHGEIGPMPDCAVFADTGWEPQAVYDHLEWLMSGNVLPFPFHIVSAGNIRDDLIGAGDGKRWASIPAFAKTVTPAGAAVPVYDEVDDGELIEIGSRAAARETVSIGMIRRQCTTDYKIVPIRRKGQELASLTRKRSPDHAVVEQWIGISCDETVRAKPSFEPGRSSAFRSSKSA